MAVAWREFEAEVPKFASAGRRLIYPMGPHGPGLGFLATTRADGGPRVHPVCPAIFEGGLYVFVMGTSPKRGDLVRDGRYAFHAFPHMDTDESFYCCGSSKQIDDASVRAGCPLPWFKDNSAHERKPHNVCPRSAARRRRHLRP